jgi:hypothetical protein
MENDRSKLTITMKTVMMIVLHSTSLYCKTAMINRTDMKPTTINKLWIGTYARHVRVEAGAQVGTLGVAGFMAPVRKDGGQYITIMNIPTVYLEMITILFERSLFIVSYRIMDDMFITEMPTSPPYLSLMI